MFEVFKKNLVELIIWGKIVWIKYFIDFESVIIWIIYDKFINLYVYIIEYK